MQVLFEENLSLLFLDVLSQRLWKYFEAFLESKVVIELDLPSLSLRILECSSCVSR